MATKKKSTKKSGKFQTSMRGIAGFSKKGKNADGKNITFDELVHYIQSDIKDREKLSISLDCIKKVIYYLGGGIADNLGKGYKVCVSVPELGTFKTSVRKYSIGGKSGNTKTVKFTPSVRFKEYAKLGAK